MLCLMPNTYITPRTRRIMPPAIIKLDVLIPKKLKIATPKNRKINSNPAATPIALFAFLILSFSLNPFVSEIKIGIPPKGSMITNNVMNDFSSSSSIVHTLNIYSLA